MGDSTNRIASKNPICLVVGSEKYVSKWWFIFTFSVGARVTFILSEWLGGFANKADKGALPEPL